MTFPAISSGLAAPADPLSRSVDALLVRAMELIPGAAEQLTELRRRITGPLRLALAGKIKAGKSTLLNALLGEELAPTDAGECTKIVTWYSYGDQPAVVLHPRGGTGEPTLFRRSEGALDIDLRGHAAEDLDRLEVFWPTRRLAGLTLIDTPGIASLSTDVSARTLQMLNPDENTPPAVDAVLYLLRHTHASDMRFLEAFTDDEFARGTPMNTVGVLSRSDEIGACRLDAMDVASRIARRYTTDPRLRRLCPVVVPVAGLLGYAGTTLRESEFRALAAIAATPGRRGPVAHRGSARRPTVPGGGHRDRAPASVGPPRVVRGAIVRRTDRYRIRFDRNRTRSAAHRTQRAGPTARSPAQAVQ